jgi:hypothetical protein
VPSLWKLGHRRDFGLTVGANESTEKLSPPIRDAQVPFGRATGGRCAVTRPAVGHEPAAGEATGDEIGRRGTKRDGTETTTDAGKDTRLSPAACGKDEVGILGVRKDGHA